MIELYLWDRCPFCQKVERAVKGMGLEEGVHYRVVDGSPGSIGSALVEKKGGKRTVPFLVDGEHSMYESDDIIAYLKTRFGR